MVNCSLILVLLTLLDRTPALSWLARLKKTDIPTGTSKYRHDLEPELDALGLSADFPDDLPNLGLNLEALGSYSFKPDCFKQAANKITSRCQDLELDEEARVNAAIVMTICEVATGEHYSLPLECMAYSVGQDVVAINPQTRGKCVDALARSPQFWSSYSGYLREIPQLCHAYRRWADTDLARNIYYNVTIEKINFLKFLFDHEKKSDRHLQDMILQSEILRDMVHEMKNHVDVRESSAGRFMMEIETELHRALEMFKTQCLETLNNREKAEAISITKHDASLEDVFVRNSVRLDEFGVSLSKIVRSHVDELVLSHNLYYEQLFRDLITTRNGYLEFRQGFAFLKQEVKLLLEQTINISDVVVASLGAASSLQIVQAETSRSAFGLVQALENLTEITLAELNKINISAFEVQQRLLAKHDPGVPWRYVVLQIFSIFGQGYDLSTVQNMPSFRFLLSIISCLWTIFRIFVSSIMGTALSLLLSQSHVSRFFWRTTRARPPAASSVRPSAYSDAAVSLTGRRGDGRFFYVSRIPRRLCQSQ